MPGDFNLIESTAEYRVQVNTIIKMKFYSYCITSYKLSEVTF